MNNLILAAGIFCFLCAHSVSAGFMLNNESSYKTDGHSLLNLKDSDANFSESSITASRLKNRTQRRSPSLSPVTTNGKISNFEQFKDGFDPDDSTDECNLPSGGRLLSVNSILLGQACSHWQPHNNLLIASASGNLRTMPDPVGELLKTVLLYPSIGTPYSNKDQLCRFGSKPKPTIGPAGYTCGRRFSTSSLANRDDSFILRGVQLSKGRELQAVVIGIHNVINDVEQAEIVLKEMYGHLGVKRRFESHGADSQVLLGLFDGRHRVKRWNVRRYSFGCDAISSEMMWALKLPTGGGRLYDLSPEVWKIGDRYLGVLDFGSAFDYQIRQSEWRPNGDGRCVLANIVWGLRKPSTSQVLGNIVVQISIAEISTALPAVSWLNNWTPPVKSNSPQEKTLISSLPEKKKPTVKSGYAAEIRDCVAGGVVFTEFDPKSLRRKFVKYRIELNDAGLVIGVHLLDSTGESSIDDAVMKGVWACSPFPRPPGRPYPQFLDFTYSVLED